MRKHIIYGMSFLIIASTGCSREEQNPEFADETSEITFTPCGAELRQAGKASTRTAFIRYYDDMTAEQIAVTAVMSETYQHYFEETLAYSETSDEWNTTGKHFWPSQTLNFFALLPLQDTNRGEVSYMSTATFTYTSPRENDRQGDLMYACSYGQTKDLASGNVPLYFLHPLAAISFKAKTENSSISVDIKGIELHNVSNSATFIFPTTSTVDMSAINPEGSEIQAGIASWDNLSEKTAVLEAGIAETTLSSVGEPQTVTAENGELFLIPQQLTAWDRGTDDNPINPQSQTGCYLVIRCRLASSGLYLTGSPTSWGEIYVPYGGTFEQGQHYVVSLNFGLGFNEHGDKNQIQVTTTSTIADWERETINFDKYIL